LRVTFGGGVWALASRALGKRRSKRCGAPGRVVPVLPAFRADVKMRTGARSRHRLGAGLGKTPRTARGKTVQTVACVLPVSVAHVAVMRVELPDQQVVPAAAHGTVLGTDEWQIARDRVVAGNAARGRGGSAVLPAMTGRAPVRMLGARRLQLAWRD